MSNLHIRLAGVAAILCVSLASAQGLPGATVHSDSSSSVVAQAGDADSGKGSMAERCKADPQRCEQMKARMKERQAQCAADPEKCRAERKARCDEYCKQNPQRCEEMKAKMKERQAQCKADPDKCKPTNDRRPDSK